MFSSELFKKFEQELLTVAEQEEDTFPVAHMVQLAMPQLASDMQSGFLHISSMMKDMQEQIRTLQTYNNGVGAQVEQKFADFLSFGSQLFRNGLTTSRQEDAAPDHVDIDDVARISEPFTTVINQQISANNSNASVAPPSYALSRTIVTVTDLWREYSTGLTGCPSVRDLEQQFGASWRKGNESRFFSRRNEIYKYIKDKAVKERITEEEAAKKLEEKRRHIGVSIDKLRKLLKEELSQTRVELLMPTD